MFCIEVFDTLITAKIFLIYESMLGTGQGPRKGYQNIVTMLLYCNYAEHTVVNFLK